MHKNKRMIAYQSVYDSLMEFIATLDPIKVLGFHAPKNIQERVETLLNKKQEDGLSATEREELDQCLILEHIVRLAKSLARLHIFRTS